MLVDVLKAIYICHSLLDDDHFGLLFGDVLEGDAPLRKLCVGSIAHFDVRVDEPWREEGQQHFLRLLQLREVFFSFKEALHILME